MAQEGGREWEVGLSRGEDSLPTPSPLTRHLPARLAGLRITPASLGGLLGVSWGSMAKVDLELVQRILKENGVDVRLTAAILNQIREAAAEEAPVEREKPPKKEYMVLVSEPEGGLPKDLTGWVIQYPEDGDPRDVSDKIAEIAATFNGSPKGKRVPVTSFGDACQSLPPKLLKERDVWVKTREPVRVIAVKNTLGRRRTAE